MPGKKRVEQSDDLGQIRIMFEQMRSENRLTAESVESVGRQLSAELRALETRVNGRFEVLEAVAHTHGAELRVVKADVSVLKTDVSTLKTDISVLKTDVSALKADVSGLKTDVAVLQTDVSAIKVDVKGLLSLETRVSAIERRRA